MGRLKSSVPKDWKWADFWESVGKIPLYRIRMFPPPGCATEQELLAVNDRKNGLCELIDGVLVEKPMGAPEGVLTAEIIRRMGNHNVEYRLGLLFTPDSPFRLFPGLVRLPDVAFVSFDQLPDRKVPMDPISALVPNLAVEVLSEGNTPKEMERKLKEFFQAGVDLVWIIDPKKRLAHWYTAPDEVHLVTESEVLDGGDVLPGFQLPLRELFALLPDVPPKPGKGKRTNGKGRRR
jgi:Uma2 family endonuclease